MIAEFKNIEKDMKFAKRYADGDLAVANANYQYGVAKAVVQAASVTLSCITNCLSRNLADARTTFVKACKYGKGKYDNKDQKANQESAELLGLASELYCESALELI